MIKLVGTHMMSPCPATLVSIEGKAIYLFIYLCAHHHEDYSTTVFPSCLPSALHIMVPTWVPLEPKCNRCMARQSGTPALRVWAPRNKKVLNIDMGTSNH